MGGGVQIDQQVAATDKIHAGKRRVAQNVVLCKNTDVAQGFGDAVFVFDFGKKLLQALGRNMFELVQGIFTNAGGIDGLGAEVGSENLKSNVVFLLVVQFKQQHGQGIHLFASSTSRHPNAQRFTRLFAFEQAGQNRAFQKLEGLGIPKKIGYIDQQVLVQRLYFCGFLGQQFSI